VARAAEILGVSERSFRSLIAEGSIAVVRLSARAVRIHPEDLERFIEERRGRLGS
jgi:excisionase family DNA binding protein